MLKMNRQCDSRMDTEPQMSSLDKLHGRQAWNLFTERPLIGSRQDVDGPRSHEADGQQ